MQTVIDEAQIFTIAFFYTEVLLRFTQLDNGHKPPKVICT